MRNVIGGGVIREVRFCLFALALSFVSGCGLSNQPEEAEARLYARVGKAFALVAREDVVEGKSVWSNASGFCAVENGTNYFYTSKHVVFNKEGKLPAALYVTDMSGESMVLDLAGLEVPMHNHDVVRIRVGESMSDGLVLARSAPAYGETLHFFGDALGAGVMNVEVGKVVAIGPLEFEHAADVIKGMSGGPVVNRAGEVVGLCQKGRRQDGKCINAESKYLGRVRQFGTNLNNVRWKPYEAPSSSTLSADIIHISDYRTNEVSAAGGGYYKAFFESKIELPDFRKMPASLVAQFAELTTGQKTNDIYAAVNQERVEFFKECKQTEDSDGERFVHETTATLLYQDKRFISYRINYCHFSGAPCGAANEGETKNVTFDCERGKILTAADIVSKENNRKLLNLIRQMLYQQFKSNGDEFEALSEPETRTDEEIAEVVSWAGKGEVGTPWVSDNFCLTAEGIAWTFLPCEIVSPSHGTITVEVPWRELKGVTIDL